jgi:radical SAM superfamily enzyme YgiQ (UPF0313 family)
MTRTLVINPPFLEPHRPPISCAIIAEVARLQGHDVTVLDINIDLFNSVGHSTFMQYQTDYLFSENSATKEKLEQFVCSSLQPDYLKQFDWILVSCFSTWEYAMTALIVKLCRETSSAKIVVGGPGLHTSGKILLDRGHVDYWVAGEGEIALKKIFEGEVDYPGINGRPSEQITDIESLPLPNYDFFDFNRYDWLLDSPDVFIYGSRGCVRSCTFCDVPSYWPKFRWRSGRSIANEMISNYENYGVKNFFFSDSLLNGNLKEFRIFLDTLSRYPDAHGFQWGGYAIIRPKAAHPAELFDQMKAAGGSFMSIGVETGVDRIRLAMKKHFTNDDVDWHLQHSQRVGLSNLFLMITSWYDETLEEHHEYLKIFKRWQNYAADGTIFGISINPPLAILPNTPLASEHVVELQDLPEAVASGIKNLLWVNPNNPELTFVERYRRTYEITNEATRYGWNIQNKQVRLNEIKAALQSYMDLKNQNLLRRSFPIKSTIL